MDLNLQVEVANGTAIVSPRRGTKEELEAEIRGTHSKWVKSWILQRQAQGAILNLFQDLALTETDFKNVTKIFPVSCSVSHVEETPITQRQNTNYQDSIYQDSNI